MKLALVLALATTAAHAEAASERVSVVGALLSESAKLHPAGFNPGFLVGAEVRWLGGPRHALVQALDFAFAHHPDLADAMLFETQLGYRFTAPFGLMLEALVGAGYRLDVYSEAQYALVDGRYRAQSGGASAFEPSVSLGLGWRFSAFSLFARYRLGFELPGPYGVLGYPQTQVMVGVSVPVG